jgi:hypothetical protein
MKNIIMLLGSMAAATCLQQPTITPPGDTFARGAWHREVASTSPFASEEIKQVLPERGVQFKISVKAIIHNLSGHELVYVNPDQYYDVYDNRTGTRAVNTTPGCYVNFFLNCFQPKPPGGTGIDGPPKDIIPASGSIEKVNSGALDVYWDLPPGTYTVVGIYCATQREGPECFKSSNTIQITIPKHVKYS